jgi:hypothetical protein
MSEFFNRQGEPISLEMWGQLCEDDDYRQVARTQVGRYDVSTVWIGLNHQWWPGMMPLFFETMVFDTAVNKSAPQFPELGIFHPAVDELTRRYPTEQDALLGHDAVVGLLADVELPSAPIDPATGRAQLGARARGPRRPRRD